MSLQVSKLIANVQAKDGGADIPGHVIATAMALLAGIIVLAIGLLRLGWLVEFISVSFLSSTRRLPPSLTKLSRSGSRCRRVHDWIRT